jgi:hypothetical protein
MLTEMATGRNAFASFGGVHEIAQMRNGLLRCQGPFAHPILAGTFGATQLPLFIALWFQEGRSKLLPLAAMLSSLVIMIAIEPS